MRMGSSWRGVMTLRPASPPPAAAGVEAFTGVTLGAAPLLPLVPAVPFEWGAAPRGGVLDPFAASGFSVESEGVLPLTGVRPSTGVLPSMGVLRVVDAVVRSRPTCCAAHSEASAHAGDIDEPTPRVLPAEGRRRRRPFLALASPSPVSAYGEQLLPTETREPVADCAGLVRLPAASAVGTCR